MPSKTIYFVRTSNTLYYCYNVVFLFHCFLVITVYRRNAGEKSSVPLRLPVPKITISLPPGEEGEGGCGWAPGEEGEGGYGWAPEIPFVDLTESERQLERKVSLDFDICFLYTNIGKYFYNLMEIGFI